MSSSSFSVTSFFKETAAELKDGWTKGYAEALAEEANKNKQLSYWCKLFEDFNFSPKEFYALVEKNLDHRKVPDLEPGYTMLHEGNMFSKQRMYLQMRRERLVFEICAAPFGSGFFVSSRLFDRRKEAHAWHYLLLLAVLLLIGVGAWIEFGWVASVVIFGTIITTLWSMMRLGTTDSVKWLDEKLYTMPWIGPIYESLFHPETYFRQDQNNMYRECVHNSVMQAIKEMTELKGIKPLSELEARPILRGLDRH